MNILETLNNMVSSHRERDILSEADAEDVERLVAKLLWRDEERKNPTLYELSKREEDREELREHIASRFSNLRHYKLDTEFLNAIPDDLDPFERRDILILFKGKKLEGGGHYFDKEVYEEIRVKLEEYLKHRHAVLAKETLHLDTVKERIGKLERWILIHTYLKTIKGVLPEGFKKVRWYEKVEHYLQKYDECYKNRGEFFEKYYDRTYEKDIEQRKNGFEYDIGPIRQWLLKSEILLNCFDLELSDKYSWRYYGLKEIFKVSTAYKKALVSVTRALNSLTEKEYIIAKYFAGASITLTERGILKVERMLNVNSCYHKSSINIKD